MRDSEALLYCRERASLTMARSRTWSEKLAWSLLKLGMDSSRAVDRFSRRHSIQSTGFGFEAVASPLSSVLLSFRKASLHLVP